MSSQNSRRHFLKTTALTGAGMTLAGVPLLDKVVEADAVGAVEDVDAARRHPAGIEDQPPFPASA